MDEIKSCFKWLAIYALLLAGNAFLDAKIIPPVFPAVKPAVLYLLCLSVCLILRYHLRVAQPGRLKTTMLCIGGLILLFALLRGIKYSVVGSVAAPGRYVWYLYYVPLLCIPQLLFYVSLYVYAKDERQGLPLDGDHNGAPDSARSDERSSSGGLSLSAGVCGLGRRLFL